MILNKNCVVILSMIFIYLILASGCLEAKDISGQNINDKPSEKDGLVTFIELGSVKCIPCKQMQPIMDAIEKEYAGKVKVVFFDVWTNEGKPYAKKYKVRLIPTQVFLDKEGNEFFRHEGFLPKKEIEKVLLEVGVEK